MPNINTKVKLTGESEYRQALSNVNASMKVLNSEMKLTTAQFAENGKSVDALKAKNDVLTRSISSQEEKLELMKAQLKKTADAYGEGSTKTMKLQAAVNSAEAELQEMKNTLKENEQAIDAASDKSNKFGDAIQGIADKLGINLPPAAQGAINAIGGVSSGAALAATGVGLLIAAVVKAEKALIDMTKQAAANADELITLSSQTGLSTRQLQEFQYASELVDVSMDTLQGSLTKLTQNMDSARDGTGKAKEAFDQLGISVTDTDGNLRSAKDVFDDAIDALGNIENQTERDALAMEIFGRSAQDLNPLIDAGSEKFNALAKEAEDTGYVLDDLALNKLGAVDDAFQRLDKTKETFQKRMSAEFAPYISDAVNRISDVLGKMGKALVDSGAAKAFGSILQSAISLLEPLGNLVSKILPALAKALQPVALLFATIADAADVVAGIFSLDLGRIKSGLGIGVEGRNNNSQRVLNSAKGWQYDTTTNAWIDPNVTTGATLQQEYNQYVQNGGNGTFEYWYQVVKGNTSAYGRSYSGISSGSFGNAAGTQSWRGGWSWVGENGPELAYLPRGSQVMSATESRESTGDVFNISIDAKSVREFNDIIEIARTSRMRLRKEGAV